MAKLLKVAYHSVSVASRQPRWWLLAFCQAAAFSIVGRLARPQFLGGMASLSLLLAALSLSPLTIFLWQRIESDNKKLQELKPKTDQFLYQCLSGGVLILSTVLLIVLARLLFPFWPAHTLVFAVAASTVGLALLYLSLCGQSLNSALRLALYTWNKKISFVAAAALVLILAHGISFSLVHGVWGNAYTFGEFSVFGHSATIWILLAGLSMLIAYFSAILNCFVVFLFLETINRKKDPEEEKIKAVLPVRVGAS